MLVFQQLYLHICLAILILSCCFDQDTLVRQPGRGGGAGGGQKESEKINFAKHMCE